MSEATPFDLDIHQRLLCHDHTATSVLAERYLPIVMQRTAGQARRFKLDYDDHHDIVVDAILDYGERPQQYQPAKKALLDYFVMAVYSDIKTKGVAQYNRRKRSISLEAVGDRLDVRNGGQNGFEKEIEQREMELQFQATLERVLTDPIDRQLAAMMFEGRTTTDDCAGVLGIDHLDTAQKRRIVNQHKDRIKKKLLRHGGHSRGSN